MAALVLLAAAAAPQNASARDPFSGQWGGDCSPEAQCWLEVTGKKDREYDVVFVAADRMDAAKILCRVAATMKRQRVLYSPSESYDDALGGEVNGSPTYVATNSDGSLILGGGLKAGPACGKHVLQQVYYPIGD